MPNLQPHSYVFNRAFHDFDELSEAARAWDLEFSQLDRGGFDGELAQIGNERFNFAYVRYTRHLLHRGAPPKGFRTFVIPADREQHFLWRRKEITGEHVPVFPIGGELDAVSWLVFQVFTLSFSEEMLAEAIEAQELSGLQMVLRNSEVCTPHPEALHLIRHSLQNFFRHLIATSSQGNSSLYQDDFGQDLCTQLLKGLAFSHAVPSPPSPLLRHKALKRVEDYLFDFPTIPHTLLELCRVAQVSERTLEYAFLERFGVSPKAYLHRLRLNGVRKALRNADPTATSVTALAIGWGFWHMGQFAKDYKRLFAELPSETLKKRHVRL